MIMFLNLSDIIAEGMFRNCLSWCVCVCVLGGGGYLTNASCISPCKPHKGVTPLPDSCMLNPKKTLAILETVVVVSFCCSNYTSL